MALLALASGIALAMMAARMMALLALVMVSLAPALLALPPLALALLALVPAGARAQRLELKQLKARQREPDEASGLVRGRLPRLQGAAAAAEASSGRGALCSTS